MNKLPENINQDDYKKFIKNIKENIKNSQLKAAIKVNYELLNLYWNMGKEIKKKQKESKWGDGFLKNLSEDLKKEFPDMKGFSERNIRYMCKWYEFYSIDSSILLQPVAELEKKDLELVKMIPWGHNQVTSSNNRGT